MNENGLTPCDFYGLSGWWAKREDRACYAGPDLPSGAKVRQYAAMIAAAPPDAALAVGCSAVSAMQVYVAAMHKTTGRPAFVVVPRRRERHPSTAWAAAAGARIEEIAPGYPTQYKARIRAWLNELGLAAVPWDRRAAALDTAAQTQNLPADARRVVVPSGSGLTAAGIIGGLHEYRGGEVTVLVVATSGQGAPDDIYALVARYFGAAAIADVPVVYVPPAVPYGRPVRAALPDGTPLDPWYAAKARAHCRPGDVLWIIGRRPAGAIYNGARNVSDRTHSRIYNGAPDGAETLKQGQFNEIL